MGVGDSGHGGIGIVLGRPSPCLIDRETGDVVQTEMAPFSMAEASALDDWNFNWVKEKRMGHTVVKLTLQNKTEPQGLLAYVMDHQNGAVYVSLVESAPHNFGSGGKYEGVGFHLFAYAGKVAYDEGYDYIYFKAKASLMDYYRRKFGAYATGFENRMIIDGDNLKRIVETYYDGGDDCGEGHGGTAEDGF